MDRIRSAIVFGREATGVSPVILDTLRQLDLNLLLPHQLTSDKNGISIIIIDRPASFAETICSNLRENERLSQVPILVISEGLAAADKARFAAFNADVLPPTVTSAALRSFLEKKLLLPQAAREKSDAKAAEGAVGRPSAPKPQGEKATPPPTVQAGHGAGSRGNQKVPASETVGKEASKMVKTTGDLKNDIPSSTRLLPTAAKPWTPSKAGVRCDRCLRWQARTEDAVCSRCGNPLIALELSPEVITFEPREKDRQPRQLLELRNAGQNPLRLLFNIRADEQLAKRFSLRAREAVLDGQSVEDQMILFDAADLDLKNNYEGLLEISTNEKGSLKRQVRLVVERLPKGRVIAHSRYIYAVEIDKQTWNLTLGNNGGGTLEIEELSLNVLGDEPTDQTEGVPLELLEPVSIRGGQSAPVRLKIPALNLKLGKYKAELWWKFKDLEGPLKLPIVLEAIQPPKLNVQPEDLDFGAVSTRRSKPLALLLNNGGKGEDLTITSIEPSVSWIKIADEIAFPYVLPRGNKRSVNFTVTGSNDLAGAHQQWLTIHSDSYDSRELRVPFYVEFVESQEYEPYIGIDFGTTASCVAVLDKNGEPSAIPLVKDRANPYIMPSALYFRKDGKVLTGWDALEESGMDPANTVTSFKRALGLKQERELAGKKYSPTELTAIVIDQLILHTEDSLFERREYKTPRRAVVTVPVGLIDQQKHTALLEACELAGLETISKDIVINEAHAVALYYLNKRIRKMKESPAEQSPSRRAGSERVLVFDFGGGTLDCELIEIEKAKDKTILRILASGGDPHLGGEDIDWALAKVFGAKAKQVYPEFDENCLIIKEQDLRRHYRDERIHAAAMQTRAKFKREAERVKIELSQAAVADVQIQSLLRTKAPVNDPYLMDGSNTASFKVQFQQKEFEQVLEPFLVRAADAVEDVCKWAEIDPKEIETILHAGRSSRLPQVKERIKKLLGDAAEDRSDLIEPKVCVALGAAFWGKIKGRLGANIEIVGSAIQRMYDIGYLGFDHDTFDEVFIPIFSARTEPPSEVVIEVPRSHRDVFELPLVINRGKSSQVSGNDGIKRIGVARIIARGVAGESISVRFFLNEKGLIEVSHQDQIHVFEHEEK